MKRVVLSGVCSKMSAESANVWGHLLGAWSIPRVAFTDMIQLTMTLKVTTTQVVKTSVTVNNSPIQDYIHPDDHAPPTYEMIPAFKPFTIISLLQFNSETVFVCLFVCLCIELSSI